LAQFRQNRIAEEIKKSLDRAIREQLRDPRITGTFSITRVEPAKDLRYAKVYVSMLEDDKLEGMVKALKGASGLLRHILGSELTLRYVPELQFIPDKNIAYGLHIAGVLKKVLGDGAQKEDHAED
jgi:ribosome-binding factor A